MKTVSSPEASESTVPFSKVPIALFIRGVVMVVVMVGVVASLHYYLGTRLIERGGVSGTGAWVGWVALVLLFVSIPLGFATLRARATRLTRQVAWLSNLWIGAFGVLLTVAVSSDLVLWILGQVLNPAPAQQETWHRVQAALIAGISLPALVYGFWVARGAPRLERVTIRLSRLPKSFEGFRIVQLSDVHIGPTLDRAFLQRVVNRVNALRPDLVALTGDLVDGSVMQLRSEMTPLAELRAAHGVFFVTGNHEYYSGGAAWEAEMARLGVTVLHNEHRVLERGGEKLVVAGITDYDGGQFGPEHASRPEVALAGAPLEVARILLAHQPRSARLAAPHGVDLQLSGHTHGGQIFPWMFFVLLQQPVISGLKTLYGIQVYTSRGTGYWGPPIRLGPTAEISELTLSRPQA